MSTKFLHFTTVSCILEKRGVAQRDDQHTFNEKLMKGVEKVNFSGRITLQVQSFRLTVCYIHLHLKFKPECRESFTAQVNKIYLACFIDERKFLR